jgi:mannosylglycerate hydrolase
MPAARRSSLDLLLLAHTHWDREWYRPAPQFRRRLVALVEQLLQGGTDPARPFLLDGQAVVIDDVLAARPSMRDPLVAALRSGAIEAGPWYVLADELLPSGEALVRNLLAGRRVLQGVGAVAPPVCYSPDAFGHAAALPALAAGFGLPVGVLWRGYGGARWPSGDTFRWCAPNGDALLVWHLPPDGYEYASALPTSATAADARWQAIEAQVAARARTGVVLLTNGADHHARQEGLDEAVQHLAAAVSTRGYSLSRASLRTWADRFTAAARTVEVPEVHGELRDSYGYTWTLQGTFATRSHQKRAVARADRLLRCDVEPWLALLACQHAGGTPERSVPHTSTRRARTSPASASDAATLIGCAPSPLEAMLERTWRTFLRTLPHDTLCGCSVDAVARALDHRLDVVRQEAVECRDAALAALLGHDPVQARARTRAQWAPHLVLANRVARPRFGVAEVELVRTVRDVAVGPGSQAPQGEPDNAAASSLRPHAWCTQPLHVARRYERRESPQHYPDNDLVEVTRALVWVPSTHGVSGHGLRTVPLHDTPVPASRNDAAPTVRVTRRGATATLENDALRLRVTPTGITLFDRERGVRIDDLLQLTWQADHGDTYTAAPRGALRQLRAVRARLVLRGPLRAAVTLTYALRVLARSAPDERQLDAPRASVSRNGQRWRRVVVHVTCLLDAGARHVVLRVQGRDDAGDHRLRLSIGTGLRTARVVADAAIWPVTRGPLAVPHADTVREQVTQAAPLHRWVAAHDGRRAVTLVSDGLAEYEPVDATRLAVTLVRATGELSRAGLPERPGHAGWPARVPAAQGPGPFRALLAIAPGGPFDPAAAHALADDVLLPLVGRTWRDATEHAPVTVQGITLSAARGVVALAVKPADDGDGVVLRCVNLDAVTRRARWVVPMAHAHVERVRLDETPVPANDSTVRITAPRTAGHTVIACTLAPYALLTLRVRASAASPDTSGK